MLSLLIIKC